MMIWTQLRMAILGLIVGAAGTALYLHYMALSPVKIPEPLPDWVIRHKGQEITMSMFPTPSSISSQGLVPDALRLRGAVMPIDVAAPDGTHIHPHLTALIDTGSDNTYVKTSVLQDLGIPPLVEGPAYAGVEGQPYNSAVYPVRLKLPNGSEITMKVLSANVDNEDILLGRDLLSKTVLTYDGINNRYLLVWGPELSPR